MKLHQFFWLTDKILVLHSKARLLAELNVYSSVSNYSMPYLPSVREDGIKESVYGSLPVYRPVR
jgi:hypothetical protein